MLKHAFNNSCHIEQTNFSSNKKKLTTPALLFCKSNKDSSAKNMSENNPSLYNTNRSPLRSSNAKNDSFISRSPLINKSNTQSQSKSSTNLIFSRSRAQDQNYEDSLINQSVRFCQNHQNTPALYTTSIDNVQTQYYCHKCAILLASQGYTVSKLDDQSQLFESRKKQVSRNLLKNSSISQKSSKSNNSSLLSNSRSVYSSSQSRKFQIQNFLQSTRGLLQQIQDKKQQIRENLIQSQEFYGQQIEQINEYFQLVYKSLQLQKNKCYNYILNQRVQVQQPIRMINQTITDLKQKIQDIIQDIQENIQTVYFSKDQMYRPVIQQYQDNYRDIQSKIAQIQVSEIEMRKIDFQGVPQSVFYLSDILKESIQQNYKPQNQLKLNEKLNSLRQSLKDSIPHIQPKRLFSKRNDINEDSFKKNSNYFSFEGQAFQMQIEQQKIMNESSSRN